MPGGISRIGAWKLSADSIAPAQRATRRFPPPSGEPVVLRHPQSIHAEPVATIGLQSRPPRFSHRFVPIQIQRPSTPPAHRDNRRTDRWLRQSTLVFSRCGF